MPSKKGLFFSDVVNDIMHVLINTVERMKVKSTVKEYSEAKKLGHFKIIGIPST